MRQTLVKNGALIRRPFMREPLATTEAWRSILGKVLSRPCSISCYVIFISVNLVDFFIFSIVWRIQAFKIAFRWEGFTVDESRRGGLGVLYADLDGVNKNVVDFGLEAFLAGEVSELFLRHGEQNRHV